MGMSVQRDNRGYHGLLVLFCLICQSADLFAQPKFSVSISDPLGEITDFHDEIESNVLAAANLWGANLAGDASIEILVSSKNLAALAIGTSAVTQFVTNNGSFNIFEPGMLYELRTGIDPNGEDFDVLIDVSTSAVQNNRFWFDPSPEERTDPVASGKFDAVSLFLHELGHGVGFNSFIERLAGEFLDNRQTTFDEHMEFDGDNFFFTGPTAQKEYGGPVPLTFQSQSHVGNSSPRPGSDLTSDLMNGVLPTGQRLQISSLDLAMLQDFEVVDAPAPLSANVFVRGQQWSSGLLTYLEDQGLGDAQHGYLISDLDWDSAPIPWINVDEVTLVFDQPTEVDALDLRLAGDDGDFDLANGEFSYDENAMSATWTLGGSDSFFADESVVLMFKEDEVNLAEVGVINFVGGDVDRNGLTTFVDMLQVESKVGTSALGTGGPYDVFRDLDGDGNISVTDLVNTASRRFVEVPLPNTDGVAVPEPSTLQLGLACICLLVVRYRRANF